jgi:Na+-driven multidrug efflux pump
MPINLGELFVKHATANTFKPASITVEPSDIVPLAATETPSHGKSHSGSQSTESLGTLAIPTLYLRFALPMAFAMMLSGSYNLVDSYFILKYIGADALAGVTIAFPLQMMIFALACMIGNGTATLVSRFLGVNEFDKASQIANTGFALALACGVIVTVVSLTQLDNLLAFIGISSTLALAATEYLQPIICFSLFTFLLSLSGDLLRAQGKVVVMLLVILLSAVMNILFDTLFIAVLEMGVSGAAWATVAGQCVSLFIAVVYFVPNNRFANMQALHKQAAQPICFRMEQIKLNLTEIKAILGLGSPILLSYLGIACVISLVNHILVSHLANVVPNTPAANEVAYMISAYGLIGRFNIFIALPLMALTSAAQTISAYNYGAMASSRVLACAKWGIVLTCCYLSVVTIIFMGFPTSVFGVFTDDLALIAALPLAGITGIAIAVYQGTNRPKLALLLSGIKIYGLLLPLLVLLPQLSFADISFITGALNIKIMPKALIELWMAFPIADILACLLSLLIISTWPFIHVPQAN